MEVNTIQNESLSINSANYIFNDLLSNLSVTFNKKEQIHKNFNLVNVYPNPFNPVLNIDFEINQAGLVKVEISDITGAIVNIVYDGYMTMGKHQKSWDSENLPSGLYFVSLWAGGNSLASKVVLLK